MRALPPKIAFDLERIDQRPELRDFLVGEVTNLLVRIEAEVLADLLSGRLADPVDVGETDLESLLVREVDPRDACHLVLIPAFACAEGSCR